MNQELEMLTVPAGTLIHVRGMPFELPADTQVLGRSANLQLALSQAAASAGSPTQAMESPVTSSTSNRLDESQ